MDNACNQNKSLKEQYKRGSVSRDIHWLDYVARLREELRDELPGPYHSLEHILLKIALYRREMNFPIANL